MSDVTATSRADWLPIARLALAAFGYTDTQKAVFVNIHEQRLYLLQSLNILAAYPVSTSRYGTGNRVDSYKTPLGVHRIAEKIGDDCQSGEIIRARKPTGKLAAVITEPRRGEEDIITTRVLWLEGLEPGVNLGPGVDSHERYIYIHGTPEEGLIGQPASIGCIRMKNADVIDLFNAVDEGTLVQLVV